MLGRLSIVLFFGNVEYFKFFFYVWLGSGGDGGVYKGRSGLWYLGGLRGGGNGLIVSLDFSEEVGRFRGFYWEGKLGVFVWLVLGF